MSEILPAGETEPHFAPQILNLRHDRAPSPGVTPLRLELLPSGMVIVLTQPELTLGRHSSCDVRLPLPDVSRRHCRLVFQAGRWWLLDLHSLNGIYVNDRKVQARALKPNDRIRIGGFSFLVDPQEACPESEMTEGEKAVLRSIAGALAEVPSLRKAS